MAKKVTDPKLLESLNAQPIGYTEPIKQENPPSFGTFSKTEMATKPDTRVRLFAESRLENKDPDFKWAWNNDLPLEEQVELAVGVYGETKDGDLVYLTDQIDEESGKYKVYFEEGSGFVQGAKKFGASLVQDIPVVAAEVTAATRALSGRGNPLITGGIILAGVTAKQALQAIATGEDIMDQKVASGAEMGFDAALSLTGLQIAKYIDRKRFNKAIEKLAAQGDDFTARFGNTPNLSTTTTATSEGGRIIGNMGGDVLRANPEELEQAQQTQDLATRPVEEGGIGVPLAPDQLITDGPVRNIGDTLRQDPRTSFRMGEQRKQQDSGARELLEGQIDEGAESTFVAAENLSEAAQSLIDDITKTAQDTARPLYEKAYEDGAVMPVEAMEGLLNWTESRLGRLLGRADPASGKLNTLLNEISEEVLDEAGTRTGERTLRTNISAEQLHNLRINLDETAFEGEKTLGKQNIQALRKALDDALKTITSFREADEASAGLYKTVADTKKGMIGRLSDVVGEEKAKTMYNMLFKAENISPAAVQNVKQQLAEVEGGAEAFDMLVGSYIRNTMIKASKDFASNTTGKTNWVGKVYAELYGDPRQKELIRAMLPSENVQLFDETMQIFASLKNVQAAGSATFTRGQVDRLITEEGLRTGTAPTGMNMINSWINFPRWSEHFSTWVETTASNEALDQLINIFTNPNSVRILREISESADSARASSARTGQEAMPIFENSEQSLSAFKKIFAISTAATLPAQTIRGGARTQQRESNSRGITNTAQSRIRRTRDKYPNMVKNNTDAARMERLERIYSTEEIKGAIELRKSNPPSIKELRDYLDGNTSKQIYVLGPA